MDLIILLCDLQPPLDQVDIELRRLDPFGRLLLKGVQQD
jgi:hypothetical protein